MDAGSLALLHRLIALEGRSLLQYVSDSSPWTSGKTQGALKEIFILAKEEQEAVSKLMGYLQKIHVRRMVLDSYPASYTMMNFVTVDFLLPRLIADNEIQVAEIERRLASVADEKIRSMIQGHLDMKGRHLQTFKDLSARILVPSA